MREPQALQVRFNFHPELCTGCGACVTACMDEHDAFPVEAPPLRRLSRTEHVRKGEVQLTWYSLGCLHCAAHGCMNVCPKKCFTADPETGTIQLDNTGCVGCKACARACGFQGIVFGEDRKARKCDGCLERLKEGRLPRCVAACPRHAITIDDRPALLQKTQESLRKALARETLR